MSNKPYLNLGCGKVILPNTRPAHHGAVPEAIYSYPDWVNVDRLPAADGITLVDVFSYPFPWADNSFDGALLTHICEHIPHEVDLDWQFPHFTGDDAYSDPRTERLQHLSDGFYAFFAELHRVLTPGAVAHVVAPYAFSTGAMQDPTHRRYLTPESFTYLVPNDGAPFALEALGAWSLGEVMFDITPMGEEIQKEAYANAMQQLQARTPAIALPGAAQVQTQEAMQIAGAMFMRQLATRVNIASEFYIPLTVVK